MNRTQAKITDRGWSGSRALIVAGTRSGCGKTTLSLGLMAALGRYMVVQPFKCGPDFIDPTLHQLVTGRVSRNLDVRMCGLDFVTATLARHAPEQGLCLIEGVMGLFDGGRGSAAYLAAALDIPVLLVVDVRSAAESVAAQILGFECFDPRVRVAGVILNRVAGSRHRELIAGAMRDRCRAELIGALPRDPVISLPSRHLGLHMGSEAHLNQERLVNLISEHLDLERLAALAGPVRPGQDERRSERREPEASVRLGIAWDEAFCFYYQDNLDMLRQAGAELVVFSPLHDRNLPPGLDGLYLGGGYPELFARDLAANREMREEILSFSRSGRPVYAECGGFMYLCRSIVEPGGEERKMCGVFPVQARMGKRPRRLGYRRVETRCPTPLGAAGTVGYGHEFHYSEIGEMPGEIERGYLLDDGRREGYLRDRTLAGYVHLHWGRTPEIPACFVRAMQEGN